MEIGGPLKIPPKRSSLCLVLPLQLLRPSSGASLSAATLAQCGNVHSLMDAERNQGDIRANLLAFLVGSPFLPRIKLLGFAGPPGGRSEVNASRCMTTGIRSLSDPCHCVPCG